MIYDLQQFNTSASCNGNPLGNHSRSNTTDHSDKHMKLYKYRMFFTALIPKCTFIPKLLLIVKVSVIECDLD